MPNETKSAASPLSDPPIDAYYDSASGRYLIPDNDGNWMPVDTNSLKIRLKKNGMSNKVGESQTVSSIDNAIVSIQHNRNVQYVGGLAGFARGSVIINGVRVLVTHSPNLIVPTPGKWPVLRAVIDGQLNDRHFQSDRFHGLMKLWIQSLEACLRTGKPSYGQTLILAGPRACGKSLLQDIITLLLGGRQAKSYRYMAGETPFNRDLFSAEHQRIEDDQPFKDYKSRAKMGDAMKNVSATISGSCHGKNREAISLNRFWRLTVSVNDSPDNLEILPPFDDSLLDKIILLHCTKKPMPMPAGTDDEKEAFMGTLKQELPAYVHWLKHDFSIPAHMVDNSRYGIGAFFHPHIMALLNDMTPETRLLAIVDLVVWFNSDSGDTWEGTAEELTKQLMESGYKDEARSIIPREAGCGRLLGRLADLPNPRVTRKPTRDSRNWIIAKPMSMTPCDTKI
jgi:hypothetical protein